MFHRPKHIRTRLTLWYLLVLAGVLAVYTAGTLLLLFWQLRTELDHHAIQDLEAAEGLLTFQPDGKLRLRDDYHNHPESKLVLDWFLEVLTPQGAVLFRNDRLGARSLGGKPFPGEGIGGYSERSGQLPDGPRLRLISRRHAVEGHPTLIRLAYSQEPLWTRWNELFGASLLMFPLTLGVAGLLGFALARRELKPLERMAGRAEAITSDRLNERLPGEDSGDELGQLAVAFNKTLNRLEQSFEQLKRFTSDASHELRTPLASIRSVGEVGLQRDGSCEHYRDVIGSMLEEVNRLTQLVDSLLTISRGDAGQIQLRLSRFPIIELVHEVLALFEILIEDKQLRLAVSGDHTTVVEGDRTFLRQALLNIIHNAVKFSPAGGAITVQVHSMDGDLVAISISDSGPGIPPEHRAQVFDRFYRVDPARSRDSGGAGLGLSIAKWAVEMHNGSIILESAAEGSGSRFLVQLPATHSARPT